VVCKKFYELSQDNQVWSQFKCNSWNEKTTFGITKRKSYLAKTVSNAKAYKTLYINWIRAQGTISRQNDSLPKWFKKDEKPKFIIIVTGIVAMKNYEPLQSALIPNYAADNNYLTNKYKDKEIFIKEYNGLDSRMPLNYYMDHIVEHAKGVFYCVHELQDYDKNDIEYLKNGLDRNSPFDSQLMVLDYTQFIDSKSKPELQAISLDKSSKKWLNTLGVEFIESKDISGALDKMVNILTTKYHESYPKYLPSETEFKRYVFDPKSKLNIIPPAKKSIGNNFFSSIKKLVSKK